MFRGTAVYGPVCPVVWKGGLSPPHPIRAKNVYEPKDETSFPSYSFRFLNNEDESDNEEEIKYQKELDSFGRVKVLRTKAIPAYLELRLFINKNNPEEFCVDSPFEHNQTVWYEDSFKRMINSEVSVSLNNGAVLPLKSFCQKTTTDFYVKFPELKNELGFDEYLKQQFPSMKSLKNKYLLQKKTRECLLEIFHLEKGFFKHQFSKSTAIANVARLIEFLLNQYIHTTDRQATTKRYLIEPVDYVNIFSELGIYHCKGLTKEKNSLQGRSIMKYFFYKNKNKFGNSIAEKYFYLVIDGYFNKGARFNRLLQASPNLIPLLDSITDLRNQYGAHSGDIVSREPSDQTYATFHQEYVSVINDLLTYLD